MNVEQSDNGSNSNQNLSSDAMQTGQNDEALYPIAVLIDELKHEEVTYRLNAIRRLGTIALALGVDRARDELVPFLEESIDDEDEVLQALAEEIANLIDYIGGAQFAHVLLSPLEHLATIEETVVRDKAAESINKVAVVLSADQVERFYLPMLKRLTSGDWFTSRTSACAIYSSIYQKANPGQQEELRALFSQLCKDDTPMVRRAAATHFGSFMKVIQKANLIKDFIPLYANLSQDDQDSVRLLTVEAGVCIAELLTNDETKTHLAGTLRSLYNDKSWRVRYIIAEKFVRLANAVGKQLTAEDLTPAFVRILKDPEAEVRTSAASQLPGYCALIEPSVVLEKILPCVKELVTDGSQHVRAAIALQISGLAPVLGKENTSEHLLPLFLQALKDEFPDVRLNIISKLENVNAVIGIEALSQSLLPAIVELSEDKQWRVRLAIIEFIPLLAKQLGIQFFDDQLSSMCMSWLNDPIWSIREAATNNLRRLAEAFGSDWARKNILPKILPNASHLVFTYRLTTLFALTTLSTAMSPEVVKSDILPTLLTLCKDPVPNIRFNCAKALETVVPILKKDANVANSLATEVKPVLAKMSSEDGDADVKFFSSRALSSVA
ncbi:hypothetical protein MIR68_008208 [Amoeboaphelidium protococcarum]|nr:hypothetical protein MIR68_008208 [Amoeboaphelidium protococcarum]